MLGRFSKILVVDDSTVARKIVRALLRQLGHENVDEAPDGRAALKMLAERAYRLVISDLDMEPMNGLELLRAMRLDPRLKRIPFIMATAQSQKKFMDIARDEGATHYLVKPYSAAMLGERIARAGQFEEA